MDLINDKDFHRGLEQSLNGEFSDAILSFELASTRFEASPEVLYEIGLAYQRRAESSMPPALHVREEAAQPVKEMPGLASSIGSVVSALFGLAVVSASKAVGQTDWIVQYRDDFRKSSRALEKALEIDPLFASAHFALAHSLRYLGQNDLAATHAFRASELEPDNRHYESRSYAIDAALHAGPTQGPSVVMTWEDVVLPERTKRELRQMQLLLEKPGLSKDLGIDPPTGLLLYGPPGTGKTTIARVLAHESKCRFFATTPAEVNSMWLGESEKQVARLFAQARANAPAIVFLDEIDALLPSRSGGINQYSDKVVNQFLHEMDGLNLNGRIFVVGATNRRDMLDPALLRGGRLSREIEIPLPDAAARRQLFLLCTKNARIAEDVDLSRLADSTDGYSGANIKALVNEAGLQALIRLADGSDSPVSERKLTSIDFDEALANFKPPVDEAAPGPWRMF